MDNEPQPIAIHAGKRDYLAKIIARRYKSSAFRIVWKNWSDGTATIKVYLQNPTIPVVTNLVCSNTPNLKD